MSSTDPFNDSRSKVLRRPLAVPAPVRNPLTLVLFWLSKTDVRLVSVCSWWAMATQAALGVFVSFSALLALASAYCTCSMLDVSAGLVPCLAVGWAMWIGFLEREISGSLDRTTAVVRPLLALFISALVSVSISLFIFRNRVDQELARQYRIENKVQLENLGAAQSQLDRRRNELETLLADLRKRETDWGKTMDDELVGRTKYNRTGVEPDRYLITPRGSKRQFVSAFKTFVMI